MKRSTLRANLFVQLGLVLLVAVLLNLLGVRYFKRLDLTTDRVHSLSQPTKTLMKRLERPLVVKVFFTKGLEAPYNNHERLFVEKLEEFQAWSDGKMRIEVVDPSEKLVEIVDGEEKTRTREQEALRLGVMPNQYQYRDRTRTELRQVYMGAAFLYGERQQIIPVVNQLSGLEYDVARAIKRLIDPEPSRVGYTIGHGEVELSTDTRAPIQALRNQLAENNTMLVPVDLDGSTDQLDELEALLVVGPSSAFSPLSAFRLDQFLMSGRGVGVLLSNYQPHTESGEVAPVFHGLEGVLGAYGIRHNRDLVLDRTSNSKMPLPVRRGRVVNMVNVNTPVIPVVHDLSMDSPIVRGIPMLTMPFSSTIDLPEEETRDVVYTVLAKSSEDSSRSQAVQKIDPYTLKEPGMAETKGASAVLVQARGVFSSAFANQEAPDPGPDAAEEIVVRESADARLVVSGTSHFMANNAMAMLNLVDWLVADLSLVDIRSKTLQLPNLNPMEASQVRILKFINLLGPVFLILFFGLFRGFLRRRST